MGKILSVLLIVLFVSVGGWWGYSYFKEQQTVAAIDSFESCVTAGYPVMESYPATCSTPDGRSFTQNIGNEIEYQDEIVVQTPRPQTVMTSPLKITGKARGPWFFEASFSAELFDGENNSLGVAVISAEGEWMTTEFVPFTGTLLFKNPETNNGVLKIRNANASGLPENQKELQVPVRFN